MGQNITPTVRNLLFLNIGIFIVQYFKILPFDFTNQFGLHHITSQYFQPYQIFTHIFIHGNFSHIFSNMLALFVFGSMLENIWGAKRFLIFYLVCSLGASSLHSIIQFIEIQRLTDFIELYKQNPSPLAFEVLLQQYPSKNFTISPEFIEQFIENPTNSELINYSKTMAQHIFDFYHDGSMFGASGAVFGLLAAFALIFPNLELMLLFPPIPVKAKYMISIYMLVEIYRIVANRPDDNVAHFAHLGGALFGYIMLRIWYGNNYRQY